jgi:hypothetical protein
MNRRTFFGSSSALLSAGALSVASAMATTGSENPESRSVFLSRSHFEAVMESAYDKRKIGVKRI